MKLINFFRLESNEKLVFFQSLYWLWYFRVRLHHRPFNSLIQQANNKSNQYLINSKPAYLTVNRIAWFTNRASHFVPDATCLVQALAGKVVFSIYGYEPTIVIGVKKGDSNDILSHAWLECDGEIVIGNLEDIDQYLQITKFE
jgi:hypothetical protein